MRLAERPRQLGLIFSQGLENPRAFSGAGGRSALRGVCRLQWVRKMRRPFSDACRAARQECSLARSDE
jgi:hypothetical protein